MGLVKTVAKLGAVAGVAAGGYFLYKRFIEKPEGKKEFDDLEDVGFDYDEGAAKEESFADKIRAAAEKQLDKIQ